VGGNSRDAASLRNGTKGLPRNPAFSFIWSIMSAPVEVSSYSKDHPFPARVTENRLLTKAGSAKETRHFVVSLTGSGLHYKTGDSLGIFPTNSPTEVDDILRLLGATGDELVSPVMLKLPAPIPLRTALSSKLALAGPTQKIVATLAAKATDPDERARLNDLLAPESKAVIAAFLEVREFVDLLAEFPSARLTPQEFVDHQRRLMPRLYSIASSPKIHPTDIHLTVAVVRYETNHRTRLGACSTFLADRVQVGTTPTPVFVSHSHFGPPEDGGKDVIMVGPGTGIAPFRAFVQDRIASHATGRNWVFFGDQHRATDFLYEDEWTAWLANGGIARLDTAFSRDQSHKVYVQDRIREHAAEVWSWLKHGGHFYVCGDAKRMAKDVDVALHDVIAQQGGMDLAAAAEYVKQMKKDRRYQRDVY
jgi:sulfite reductase (NADPH) flavoprotein alpha-component